MYNLLHVQPTRCLIARPDNANVHSGAPLPSFLMPS